MAESLESFKSYIGKSEKATDVVTASAMLKFAATLGQENPPMDKGVPIPPGWYGGFFPASHRPSQMRLDGQASGGGIVPPIPLPRRRIGGTRVTFNEPLRIGDEITRVTEIADIKVEKLPGLVVQSSLISQLLMEMCRKELPARQLKSFDFKSARQIYDTGKFTIAGSPSADGREAQLWALDQDGRVSMTATAKFA